MFTDLLRIRLNDLRGRYRLPQRRATVAPAERAKLSKSERRAGAEEQ